MHAASPRGKERGVPTEEALRSERLVEITRRIKHHLDDALDFSSRRGKAGDIEAKLASDR